MAGPEDLHRRLETYERAYRALAQRLAQVGYIWQGTVVWQRLTCGKSACACHTDPQHRHGPYAYWSTKAQGRTVSRLLSAEEADLYVEWVRNRRELEEIRRKMLALSKKVAPLMLRQRRSQAGLKPK